MISRIDEFILQLMTNIRSSSSSKPLTGTNGHHLRALLDCIDPPAYHHHDDHFSRIDGGSSHGLEAIEGQGTGSGSKLPPTVLWSASLSAGLATLLSFWCIIQQLRNYRKPMLQRFVVRILFMVPIYSISTLISLYSLDTAFFIDLIRDIYEAFVIYCFFGLLVEYLGGERSLLILLHGREPTPHPWPISKCISPIDISDPYTFLNIKRGIFQYVQVKPILVIFTVIFKATKTYNDGDLKLSNGYTYVSLAYNFSVSLCLYCLAVFWMCTAGDLKPFRPMPKFLCIKGIIFFSFWQGFGISILVALGLLKSTRYATETLSLAIQDTLICFEMPLFSILHLYAFSHHDFIEPGIAYCGRLPFMYAFRDSILGFKDVLEDSLMTLKGSGFSYKTFEPSEGALHHQGIVRERRVRAGLRYSAGGKQKYWLPMVGENEARAHGRKVLVDEVPEARQSRWRSIIDRGDPEAGTGYAPLLPDQAAEIVHVERPLTTTSILSDYNDDPNSERRPLTDHRMPNRGRWDLNPIDYGLNHIEPHPYDDQASDLDQVSFGEPRREEEELYRDARRLTYGDYNNPVVDASQEEASRLMRAREDGMLASHPAAPSYSKNKRLKKGKGRERESLTTTTVLPGTKRTSRGELFRSPSRSPSPSSSSSDRAGRRRSKQATKSPAAGAKTDRRKHDTPGGLLPEGCVDLLVEDREAMDVRARRNRLKGEANRFSGVAPQRVFKLLHHPELSSRNEDDDEDDDDCKPVEAPPPRTIVVDLQDDLQATRVDPNLSPSRLPPPPSPPPPPPASRPELLDHYHDRRLSSDLVRLHDPDHDDHDDHHRQALGLSSSLIRNPWDAP